MIKIIIVFIQIVVNGLTVNGECGEPSKVVSIANNELSFKIFKMLSKNNNDVMSPLSILSAFSILMNGAKGETLDDLATFLEYKNALQECSLENVNKGFEIISNKYKTGVSTNVSVTNSVTKELKKWGSAPLNFASPASAPTYLNLANRVLLSNKIKPLEEFEKIVKKSFRSDIQSADFETNAVEVNNKLNEWIRNQTNNKIQKIFEKLEKDTSAVIVNALYFKGNWKNNFQEHSTRKMDFYNNGVVVFQTDTMVLDNSRFNYAESIELESKILEMNYLNGNISFVVVLPKEIDGLNKLRDKINSAKLEQAIKSMKIQNIKVNLPKFKNEKSYDLLKNIDPKPIALTPEADLKAISSDEMKVDKILHKVFIEVNEKGTEAAAVTAISVAFKMAMVAMDKPIEFKADHPFLYFIRDKSNSMILFMGQINYF